MKGYFWFFEISRKRNIFRPTERSGSWGKMALNIMAKLEINEIIESINNENSKIFLGVTGVGNKLANRIINELKEKIKKKSLALH